MSVFEEPKYSVIVGLILFALFFFAQLVLCFKAHKKLIRYSPIFIISLISLLCFCLFIGAVGHEASSNFLGNLNQIIALICAVVAGFALMGVLLAWTVYKVYIKFRSRGA